MRWLSGKGAYDLGSCAGDAFGQVRDLAEGQDKGHEAYALLVSVVALQLGYVKTRSTSASNSGAVTMTNISFAKKTSMSVAIGGR
jgi:hypothetical protein